jgi:hypothetical protein
MMPHSTISLHTDSAVSLPSASRFKNNIEELKPHAYGTSRLRASAQIVNLKHSYDRYVKLARDVRKLIDAESGLQDPDSYKSAFSRPSRYSVNLIMAHQVGSARLCKSCKSA